MRWLGFILIGLILALQYPMWLGKGGWLQVRELERQLNAQRDANAVLKARNDRLDADVRDLKNGFEAIEERARMELGMVRHEEVFFQLQNAPVPRMQAMAQAGATGGSKTANAKAIGARPGSTKAIGTQPANPKGAPASP